MLLLLFAPVFMLLLLFAVPVPDALRALIPLPLPRELPVPRELLALPAFVVPRPAAPDAPRALPVPPGVLRWPVPVLR